jgi:hypothetical protein
MKRSAPSGWVSASGDITLASRPPACIRDDGVVPPPTPSRRRTLLVAIAVGAIAIAGAVIHGPVGGVLLLLVGALLVLISRGVGATTSRGGHPLRVLVVIGVVALAVAKLLGKA